MKLPPLTLISQKIQASEIFPALELIRSHLALDEEIVWMGGLPRLLLLVLILAAFLK